MKIFSLVALIASAYAIRENHVVSYRTRESPIPANFEGEGSDRLMNSIIGTYASEKFIDGKATGEFILDK